MRTVFFKDRFGIEIAANVHFPDGFDEAGKYPAVVISGPAGCVKEQTAGLYAGKLAESGFVAIALDSPFQGQSKGDPRFQESPYVRVEDIRSAVDYLVTLSYVDEDRIGALGICAGGGYVASAAMTERRIKAVALASPVDGGREMREAGAAQTIEQLEMIAAARTAEARGEEPMILPWMPDENQDMDDPDAKGGYDYYTDPARGAVGNWDNAVRFTCMDAVATFDAFHLCENLLTQPISIAVGDVRGSFDAWKDAHDVYERAASKDKDLVVFEGSSHFDLYDNPECVDRAVEQFATFFHRVMG